MFGKTMLMEFRKNWKGLLIFLVVVVLIVGLMGQLYPVVEEEFKEEELEREELVSLVREEIEEQERINLTWEWELDEFTKHYRVIEDTSSHMATSRVVGDEIVEQRFSINHTETDPEERYFAVIAVLDMQAIEDNDDLEEQYDEMIAEIEQGMVTVGMNSTVEPTDPLEELMDTPYFRMFTAGREDVRMDEIEGFFSVEIYSWFMLLVGLYLAYISVKSVGGDYDDRRMDIIFSTPLSKKQYLTEKFLGFGLFLFVLLLITGLSLTLSVYSIGELNEVGASVFIVSILASWPMFLVIIAVSMLFSVLFKSSRSAVGATFGVILVQYVFHMAGHMVEAIDFLRTFTIATYWDYNSVLLDGVFVVEDFIFLVVVAIVIFVGALVLFEKSDILA